MSLVELRLSNVRCIEAAQLELAPELNLITGPNGSGKTSILEGIFLLGRGRSFRTRSTDKLIREGAPALTVFGRTDDAPSRIAGVEVTRDGTRARVDGRDATSLLELSGFLPVQVIDPDIHKLIDQGSERRRRWLDWLVFHVEPSFVGHWSKYQRALKQRNAALRSSSAQFSAWDSQLIAHGEAITRARSATLEKLNPFLTALFVKFSALEISVGFHAGWAQARTFTETLNTNVDRDRERGTTLSGPHRADVVLRVKGRVARETLSRGQQKLTAVAMIISQLQLLFAERAPRALLLLDDPAAELDQKNLELLFQELASLQCQMIATALTSETKLFQAPKASFHVEQGRVIRV